MTDTPVKKSHLWTKGQSGNPKGRPPGTKNQISLVKLMVEGELRAQMQDRMADVVAEVIRQAMPSERVNQSTGEVTTVPGDKEMLKLLFKSWVSGTKSADEEPSKEKIQIVIGKLDQIPTVTGKVIASDSITTDKE